MGIRIRVLSVITLRPSQWPSAMVCDDPSPHSLDPRLGLCTINIFHLRTLLHCLTKTLEAFQWLCDWTTKIWTWQKLSMFSAIECDNQPFASRSSKVSGLWARAARCKAYWTKFVHWHSANRETTTWPLALTARTFAPTARRAAAHSVFPSWTPSTSLPLPFHTFQM